MMIRVTYEDMQDSQQREEILFEYKEEKCILEEFVDMRKLKIQTLLSA
jgi:hypothetical protein